jgi:hypothetical protein
MTINFSEVSYVLLLPKTVSDDYGKRPFKEKNPEIFISSVSGYIRQKYAPLQTNTHKTLNAHCTLS